LLSGKAGLSENMARRVEKVFEVKAETLLRMQAAYDDAEARREIQAMKDRWRHDRSSKQ
jgi:plasmid maintenance system antidote protein VapI